MYFRGHKMPAKFNPFVAELQAPPVPSVFAWGRAYDGAKGPVIDLSQAVPGYKPHGDIMRWLGEAAASTDYVGYGPIEGEECLRSAYGEHLSTLYGADVQAGNIHITSGCNQAFMCAAMAVAGSGDSIALTNPYYFNQDTTLEMLGINRVLINCAEDNDFLPKLDDVEVALKSGIKALAIVTPNNPTGTVYPAQLLEDIFQLVRRYDAWLILDETYRDFLPVGSKRPHNLLKLEGWENNLILLYSFSKSYCVPGHRLGAITAGIDAVEQIAKIMDNLQICAARAPQAAIAKAIPALKDWRDENRVEIARRVEALRMTMEALPDWQLCTVGAYFAFIKHPFRGVGSVEVAENLAKHAGVICIPGAYFGTQHEDYLRFAFANADVDTIGKLRERLGGFKL
jgi:aspartate/methionine/tyrosine aminotransferase